MPDLTWRKSTRCGASNTCVEAARTGRRVLVRDSADPHSPALALTPAAWRGLLATIKEGR